MGLIAGVTIGATYVLLHLRELKRKEQRVPTEGPVVLLWGAVARMVYLVTALAAAMNCTEADRYWLVGSVGAVYGIWFSLRMRQLLSRGK